MTPSRIVLTLLLALPLACGGGGGGSSSSPADTQDNGTAAAPSPTSTQVVVVQPGGGAPTATDPAMGGATAPTREVTPSSMQVDLEGRRVFLPNEGWLTEDEFWRIYYEEPQRLPAGLDFEALKRLGYPTEPPTNAGGAG